MSVMTLTSLNDVIKITPPSPSVLSITPPDRGTPLSVVTPPVAVEILPAPRVPSVGLVVPVAGQNGHDGRDGQDGHDGAPGDVDAPDLVDLTILFENGLF